MLNVSLLSSVIPRSLTSLLSSIVSPQTFFSHMPIYQYVKIMAMASATVTPSPHLNVGDRELCISERSGRVSGSLTITSLTNSDKMKFLTAAQRAGIST